MVSVCLPSDALFQHLPSYLSFSYLGRGVSLHGCSSKVQPLLLTLDEVTPPDLEREVAPIGSPAPGQLRWRTSEAERSYPMSEVRGKRSGRVAVRRYPSSKVRSSGYALLEQS